MIKRIKKTLARRNRKPYAYEFKILLPKLLLHRKTEDGIECGPCISRLDTGIYYCLYDYGQVMSISFLGFGIYLWWSKQI